MIAVCLSLALAADPAADRPNILFLFTDDHASHAISAYGSKINQTPQLDRLAAEGMLFRNCFCGNSICAPSRATILTGKHSHRNGVIDNGVRFDGSQPTFPKLLQSAGYQTAMIGKWHLKSDPTGFDHWDVLIGQGPYYNPPMKRAEGTFQHEGYTTDIITTKALDWLEAGRDADRPFLLMLQHKAPHREWAPGPDQLNLYDDVVLPEPPTLFDDYEGRTSAAKEQTMTLARHFSPRDLKLVPPRNLTPSQLERWNTAYGPKNAAFEAADLEGEELVRWRYQRYVKDYLRCIAAVDDSIGRVLDHLQEHGLAENTVVVYSSDQGFYLGDHGWYDKRWMYEESLRMPLIVRWPGRTAPGSECEDLVQNIDFAPTFLEMAGVELPADVQGASVVPLLEGRRPEGWRDSIYYHYYEFPGAHSVARHVGVRTESHKLIHYYQIDEWELFDLVADPDELRSVHGDPAHAAVQAELEAELRRLQHHYGEPDPHDVDTIRRANLRRRAEAVPRQLHARLEDGSGELEHLVCDGRAISVGGWVQAERMHGVILAQGGGAQGFALYLDEGRPAFAVRDRSQLHGLRADAALPAGRHHVCATLRSDGRVSLFVDGRMQCQGPCSLISRRPAEGLGIGRDPGDPVGEYPRDFPLAGARFEDLRAYWGALRPAEIRAWMQGEEPLGEEPADD